MLRLDLCSVQRRLRVFLLLNGPFCFSKTCCKYCCQSQRPCRELHSHVKHIIDFTSPGFYNGCNKTEQTVHNSCIHFTLSKGEVTFSQVGLDEEADTVDVCWHDHSLEKQTAVLTQRQSNALLMTGGSSHLKYSVTVYVFVILRIFSPLHLSISQPAPAGKLDLVLHLWPRQSLQTPLMETVILPR